MGQLDLTSWQRHRLRRQLAATEDVRLFRRTLAVLEFDHGRSAADIARMLFISVATVRKHMEHVFDRTRVRTRSAAAAIVLPHARRLTGPPTGDLRL